MPQRGSLLILCVTVLVIIALVGIAFLQRVRLDQAATARHERKYMDLVINGILAEISDQMTDDIFENTTLGKELYDYPWTDETVQQIDAYYINGSTVKVNGTGTAAGVPTHEDDRWLASTAPVFKAPDNTYNWLHLTNLTGIWLDLEATSPEQPINRRTNATPTAWLNSDINIRVVDLASTAGRYDPLGVDADGDGVFDSRWQWVPQSVREFGGRKFIMAARIVDLNSMLNVNTATNLTAIGSLEDVEQSGGYSPVWVDLSRLLSRNTLANPAAWRTEMANMLNFRIGKLPLSPFPDDMTYISSTKELETVWEEQASIYGNLDRNFVADSEVELRRFGGVNDLSLESPLEQKMPRLLRQNPPPSQPEGSYFDVVNPNGSPMTLNEALARWFYGDPNGDSQQVRQRRFPGLRHWLTTASGVGAYVTKYGGAAFPGGIRKYDLRHELNGQIIDAQKLRERIDQAFKLPASNTNEWYLGNNIASPETIDDLINEYAMCIEDYADEDSIPGGMNQGELNGAGVAYGLERLPFLREAYMHVLYQDMDLDDGSGGPPDGTYETWQAKDDTQAMVIELGNPFAHLIDTTKPDGIVNNVKVVVIQNGGEVSSWVIDNSTPNIEARNDSDTDDSDLLILVSNQLGQAPADANGQGTGLDLVTDLNISTPNLVTLPDGQLTFAANGANVTIELQVDISGTGSGPWVTYDRMETRLGFELNLPPHAPSATPNAAAPPQHAQTSFWRNKENINYISIDTGDNNNVDLPDISVAAGDFKANRHQLLTDASAPGGTWPMPAGFQLPLADQPIRSVAELAWIHMFGFTDTEPFSERVGRLPDNRHFLLLEPGTPADPDYRVISTAGVPHAAVLMDLFTTNGTHEDGLDNDNDDGDEDRLTATTPPPGRTERSIDNKTEQFIPGMINVNTAPLHILTLGSPLAGPINENEDLMRLIVAYRDRPLLTWANFLPDDPDTPGFNDFLLRQNIYNQYGVDRQNKPGIATVGELMYMGLNNDQPYSMQSYGKDGNPALPAELDLYPDTDEAGASYVSTGDNNEQKLARFQMLSQTLTTRSDRFAVYVVIRGYDWDPNAPATPGFPNTIANSTLSETARFIAIFDRSAMLTDADKPRVIGFVRLQ